MLLALLASATGTSIIATLPKEEVDAEIREHLNALRACYQRELKEHPELAGTVTMKFVIQEDGSVRSAEVKSSDLGHEGVEACLVGRFERMEFPEPPGIVIVSYPLSFEPGEPPPSRRKSRRRRRHSRWTM